MFKTTFLSLIFCVMVLVSCDYSNEPKTINHGNEFQITLPGWVKEESLAQDASISYANRYRNFYLVVIGEDKKLPADSAENNAVKRVYGILDSAALEQDEINIQGLKASHYEINGKTDKESDKIFYSLYFVEGKKKYYQICLWTRGAERRKKYNEDFYKIVTSFKEI